MARLMMILMVMSVSTVIFAAGILPAEPGNAPKILVVPFFQQNSASQPLWLQKPLARGLSARIANSSASETPAASVSALLEQARSAKASLVVYGTFRIQDETLKLTMHFLDVKTEKSYEGTNRSVALTNYFSLVDDLGDHCATWISQWKQIGPNNSDPVADFAKKIAHPTPKKVVDPGLSKLHSWEIPDDEIMVARMRQLNGSEATYSSPVSDRDTFWIVPYPSTTRPSK